MGKRLLDIDVLTAARQRIGRMLDDFPRAYVSFSGGKDSGVLLELVAAVARERGRTIGVLFVDLEAQYRLTIDYIESTIDRHRDVIDGLHWVALPIHLRNAVSQFEPQWMCWDPDARDRWVRQPHLYSVTDEAAYPFFRRRMEFEEFTPEFAQWYAGDQLSVCFVGIRSDESLNRYRTIAKDRASRYDGLPWTTWTGGTAYNAYPIYDWRTEDIWTFYAREKVLHNPLYDRMHAAGLTIHQARICQPYGDDQRKGLWLYHVIEPETWGRVVARVSGANQGALYARESGNINGVRHVDKPDDVTWREYAERLLESMPPQTAEHYRNKIHVYLSWYRSRGYEAGIPDEGRATDKEQPSWTRVVKALLRNDYWCKGLSFTQTKPHAYLAYQARMKARRST